MAKSVVYLHIGTPKTGTSAIQLFLTENREALKKKGWVFPDFGFRYSDASPTRNALWLARDMEPSDRNNRAAAMPVLLTLAGHYKGIILSEESLWTQGGYAEEGRDKFWSLFKDKLRSKDIDLKVIVYLRRQDNYLYSYWAQKVKKRDETRNFSDFAKVYGLDRTGLDYASRLNMIADSVGAENLIVHVYDREKFESGSIVCDFLNILGIETDDSFHFPEESNSSMADCILEAKRLMNRSIFEDRSTGHIYTSLWEIQKSFQKEGKLRKRNAFPNSERREFMRQYEETNAETARKYVYRDCDEDAIPPLFDLSDLDRESEDWVFSQEEIADVYNKLFLYNAKWEEERVMRQKEAKDRVREKNDKLRKRNKRLRELLDTERWRAVPANHLKEKLGIAQAPHTGDRSENKNNKKNKKNKKNRK